MVFSSVASFFGGISAAIVVKLTSSVDDVLWLAAFLTPKLTHAQRTQNALTYAGVCLLQTCLAFLLSSFGEMGLTSFMQGRNKQSIMSPDRILTLLSGFALLVYAVFLGVEYYNEKYRQHEEETERNDYATIEMTDTDSTDELENEEFGAAKIASHTTSTCSEMQQDERPPPQNDDIETADIAAAVTSPLEIDDATNADTEDDSIEHPSDKGSRSLAVVCFLGSLDDLALFVPMLVGKTFGFLELLIGAAISTVIIVLLCVFLTKCKLVADCLEKIPLVVVVFGFSVVLLVKGVVFMD